MSVSLHRAELASTVSINIAARAPPRVMLAPLGSYVCYVRGFHGVAAFANRSLIISLSAPVFDKSGELLIGAPSPTSAKVGFKSCFNEV